MLDLFTDHVSKWNVDPKEFDYLDEYIDERLGKKKNQEDGDD